MVFAPTVDVATARQALATVVPRLSELIRGIRNPAAHAIGVWSAGDVAVHLCNAWEVLPSLLAGDRSSPLQEISELGGLTTSLVAAEPERDMQALAARLDAAASAYLAMPVGDVEARPWLVEGTALPPASFACHLLNESLVHGFDIARSQGAAWRIEPAHAGMALLNFVFPALSVMDPRALVNQEKAAGVRTCVDIRLRGAGQLYFVIEDGQARVEPPSARKVDCHLSADAAALFLVVWARRSQWPSVLTGRMASWGRKPWMAARLPSLIRNP